MLVNKTFIKNCRLGFLVITKFWKKHPKILFVTQVANTNNKGPQSVVGKE